MIVPETIERLTSFDGRGLPVVSVYAGVAKDPSAPRVLVSQADSLLHQIRSLGDDKSLPREARLSLRADVERIGLALTQNGWRPGTAAAIFSCSGAGLFEEVQLPRAVRDRIVVDRTPWLRTLLAVLDEYHRCCVVVLDKESASIWELYLGELNEVAKVEDESLRNPDYAGWHGLEEHGVHKRAEELAKRHYRRVVGVVDELFRKDGYELVAVGGHQHEVPSFVDLLPKALAPRVAGTFTIDPKTATREDIRESAGAIVERYERDEERRLVADVLGTAAAGGLAAVGLERTLWAGSVAAVQLLLVQDGAATPGVVCDRSHWLGLSGDACPVCGGPTRPTDDVIDELGEAVLDEGGSIEHVQAETELQKHVVAASLRFPLPPAPE